MLSICADLIECLLFDRSATDILYVFADISGANDMHT